MRSFPYAREDVLLMTNPFLLSHFQVNEINIDYSNCEFTPSQNESASINFTNLSSSSYIYKLSVLDSHEQVDPPQYAFYNRTGADGVTNGTMLQCRLRFDVPAEIKAPVMLYYKLTNFNQNHRRYVKSVSLDQLLGKKPSDTPLSNDCKPLDKVRDQDGNVKVYYPCGMIANSMFNGESSWPRSGHYAIGQHGYLYRSRAHAD